jgi:hypothetical protein
MSRKPRLVWKYEDREDDGSLIGPAWVDTFGEDSQPVATEALGWISRTEAQTLAREQGYELLEDE